MVNSDMDKEKTQTALRSHIDSKYNGSLRFMKEKNTIEFLGKSVFDDIKNSLDDKLHQPISLMIYCFLNNITTHPKCICGNYVKFNTTRKTFASFCSPECRYTHYESTVEKRKNTCEEKYGSGTYLASKEGIEKTKQICLEKYGVDNYSKTEMFKTLRKDW